MKCAASPCSWCGRRPGKPARHVTQCAVAWQLSYSAHLLGHGDAVHGRRSSLVWAGPCGLAAASRPTHQHGRARAPTEQATSNGPARPADGARTGKGTDQRRAPTLPSQLTSGRRNSPNGQASASPRGPAGQNPNRHVARLSVEKLPRPGGLGAPIALSNSPRLEATVPAQPGRSQQDHAPDGSSPPDHGVEKESQQHVRALRGERGSEIQRLDDGSGSLGARQVECRDANPGTSGRHHQGPTRVPCRTQPGPGTPAASRGLDTFSGHPPDHGKHAGPSDNVHVRTCNPQRRGHKAAQALPQLGGPFGLAARRLADPGPAPAAQSVGTVPADRAFQALCSVRLRNYNNYCYVNSSILAILWSAICLSGDLEALGSQRGAFQAILSARTMIQVSSLMPWVLLLQGWRHEGRQHDAVEFIQFLQLRFRGSLLLGQWEARRADPQTRVLDMDAHGWVFCSMECDSHSLQDHLDAWSQQASVHAFVRPPQSIRIVLQRYLRGDDGVLKKRQPVSPQDCFTLQVPVFERELAVTYHAYRITAVTCHYGSHLEAGHYYRTCWRHPANGSLWLTDDNAVAQKISHQTFCESMHDSYIFWAVRINTGVA